jgi:hypothetical protein
VPLFRSCDLPDVSGSNHTHHICIEHCSLQRIVVYPQQRIKSMAKGIYGRIDPLIQLV